MFLHSVYNSQKRFGTICTCSWSVLFTLIHKIYKKKQIYTVCVYSSCSHSFFLLCIVPGELHLLVLVSFCGVFQAKKEWEDGWRPASSFSSLLEECSWVLPPSFPLNLYAALSALRAHSVSCSPHRSQSSVRSTPCPCRLILPLRTEDIRCEDTCAFLGY